MEVNGLRGLPLAGSRVASLTSWHMGTAKAPDGAVGRAGLLCFKLCLKLRPPPAPLPPRAEGEDVCLQLPRVREAGAPRDALHRREWLCWRVCGLCCLRSCPLHAASAHCACAAGRGCSSQLMASTGLTSPSLTFHSTARAPHCSLPPPIMPTPRSTAPPTPRSRVAPVSLCALGCAGELCVLGQGGGHAVQAPGAGGGLRLTHRARGAKRSRWVRLRDGTASGVGARGARWDEYPEWWSWVRGVASGSCAC